MSDELDKMPGAQRRDGGEGAIKRNFMDEDDVEGHSIRREGDGAIRRDADLGEGISKRNAFPDDGADDVEGHSMRRDGDGAIRRDDEGFSRKMEPGEGHSSRT